MTKHIDIDRAFGPERDLEREQREETERVALLHKRGAPKLSQAANQRAKHEALLERVEGRTQYTVYMPRELKLKLKTAAARTDVTMRELIVRAITRELRRLAKEE